MKRLKGRKLWTALVALFLLSLLLRLPGYGDQPVLPDEVNFFQPYAWSIIQEGWNWPVKYMSIHPPLYPYLLAGITITIGGSLQYLRLATVFLGALTVVFVYLLGQELFDKRIGVFAAILTAFSSYHILYSRVLMLEVPVIFFLIAGLYFYVRELHTGRSILYPVIAGLMFGLALIVKWIAVLYIPSLLLFLLLRHRSLRGLLDRRTYLVFAISGLVALPCIIALGIHGINPVYRNLGIGSPPIVQVVGIESIELSDLTIRGLSNFLAMTVHSDSNAALMIPWHQGLLVISGTVFIITMAYALHGAFRGEESQTLLLSLFLVFNVFVAFYGKRFQYYLLWSLPVYLLLVSGALIRAFRFARSRNGPPRAMGGVALVSGLLFTISILSIGILAPYNNGGPTYGLNDQVAAMRTGLNAGDSIATTFPRIVLHYLEDYGYEPFTNRILVLSLTRDLLTPIGFVQEYNLEIVRLFEPTFILTNRYYLDSLGGSEEIRTINENYRLVSEIGESLLFERTSR